MGSLRGRCGEGGKGNVVFRSTCGNRPNGSTRRAFERSMRSSERFTSNCRLPGSCSGSRTVNVLPCPGWLLRRDVAAEQLGQLADDREPEAGPLMLAGQDAVLCAGAAGLAEFLEDLLAIFLGDADPRVFDLDHREPPLACAPRA